MRDKTLELSDKNIKEKFSYLPSRIQQMSVRTADDMIWIDSGLHSNMFNIAFCNATIDRSSVQLAVDYFRSKKLPYAFWIGFEQEPSWLEKELITIGLITDEIEWAMFCDLDKHASKLIPSDFDIRQVYDRAGIQDIISVMNGILPVEEHDAIKSFYEQSVAVLLTRDCPLTFFIGYMNGNPISVSSSYCSEGLASIFDVIVLPEMRGRGLGKAMTLQAMLNAQMKGFNKCILTATNDAKYLYQKIGFEDLKTMKVYHEP